MKTREDLIKLGLEGFKADEVMMLESEMLKRAVRFQFKKKDGSVRDAVGTLDLEKMIQEDGKRYEFKTSGKPECPTTIGYWDLEKKAWRCFTITNFVGLVAVEG